MAGRAIGRKMSFDMYSEIILDHFKNPHNFGRLEGADAQAMDYNPACGDEVELFLKIKDGKILDVRFVGRGCAISQASASMLTDAIKGMKVSDASKLDRKFITGLLGVELSPTRLKCAHLSAGVLKSALAQ